MSENPTSTRVRTRFAPSPTGFIHLGNIRSALYPWAFARSQGGDFILRIEDTDLERSTQAAVDVILEGMAWLGRDHDEGPFYQMQRMDRYKAVLAQLVEQGWVYPCYMSTTELDALRERQMASKEKPRYDGTWRPEEGKVLPPVPEGDARIIGEFQDSALLTTFGRAGLGLFPAPLALTDQIAEQLAARPLGEMAGVSEQIYAISNERRIRHPAIEVLCSAAPGFPGATALPEEARRQAAPPQV